MFRSLVARRLPFSVLPLRRRPSFAPFSVMLRRRKVLEVGPGKAARLQLSLLYLVGTLNQFVGFKGTQRISWFLGRHFFRPENNVVISIAPDARLRIYLSDGYWTKLLFADYRYEPELEAVLQQLMSTDGAILVDCGANIGYWSACASAWAPSGESTVIAVEASPPTYLRLQENAVLNRDRFCCRLGAVWSEPGHQLQISSHCDLHAGASVLPSPKKNEAGGYELHAVRSTTIDEVCDNLPRHDGPLVIKLDVEGAELQAMKGAQKALSEFGAVIIYEEHGRHSSNQATKYLLNSLGMKVYFCSPCGELIEIGNESEVAAVKTSRQLGYNFLACSSDAPLSTLLPLKLQESAPSRESPTRD